MEKIKNQLQISVSNDGFVDEGDGIISFPNGLTITDDTVMRSGTRYDVPTLDISRYKGQITGDHIDSLGTLIGKTLGVIKEGNRVAIQGIKYAINENPYARLAYNLLVGGFSNSFSIETIGPYPDQQDPVYRDHELVGLSQVVIPNNYNATINQFNEIVHNSLERSQQDGLDITGVEEKIFSSVQLKSSDPVKEESMTKEEKEKLAVEEAARIVAENAAAEKAKQDAADEVAAKTAEEEKAKAEAEAKAEADAKAEAEANDKKVAEQSAADDAKAAEEAAKVKEQQEAEAKAKADEEAENALKEKELNKNKENQEMTKEEIAEIVASSVAAALKPVQDELTSAKELAQNALDAQAKEPEFKKKEEEEVKNSYDSMSEEELFGKQLNAAVAAERMQSVEGRKTLNEINARNLQSLKEAKIVNAAVTLEDLGNFVIGPELYNQVATVRTNFSVLVDATNWRETQSIQFGWLTRSSDIDMQSVALGVFEDVPSPDTSDNRLKPVSTPQYGAHTDKLEELAAVTPISINVIKFAAADILADVAEGYRTDYDRKRAQLVVARLQQAVNATGNKFTFNIAEGLIGWAAVTSLISDATTVGTLIMNNKTLTALKGQALKVYNGAILTEISQGTILGTPFIIVPNSLLPTLNTNETKTFKVYGQNVVVDTAVFYADLRTFTGRSSGGLKYDVDGSASYEIGGQVFSAYQRNEIVLRGAFFRGGVVKDTSVVASIPASAIS